MTKKQFVGTKHIQSLDTRLDKNQKEMVDLLINPNTQIHEYKGAKHKIVSTVPAYNHEAQPTQARGRIVWNIAYAFQPKGPSYLDPTPDNPHSGDPNAW